MRQPTMHDLVLKYCSHQKLLEKKYYASAKRYIYPDLTQQKEAYEKRTNTMQLQKSEAKSCAVCCPSYLFG